MLWPKSPVLKKSSQLIPNGRVYRSQFGNEHLHKALLAAGLGRDEVITVSFKFIVSVATIGHIGSGALPVDIDPSSFTLNPCAIENAITFRSRAILPMHLYGQPADMDPIMEVARRRGLVVIEDAA